jgi:Delta3-Delta2-enoyl-CoA isomerase
VVVTTSSVAKFHSNGLDYENAIKDPNFFQDSLFPMWHRLVTYPMPIIALINGHAFAGGLMMAMAHDYRIMNPHKGFLCLNELEFGAGLRPAMASLFRVKLSMSTFRNMVLETKRYPALEALKEGILDAVGGIGEALAFIEEMKLVQKAQGKSYGSIKEELYREIIKDLEEGAEWADKETTRELERSKRELDVREGGRMGGADVCETSQALGSQEAVELPRPFIGICKSLLQIRWGRERFSQKLFEIWKIKTRNLESVTTFYLLHVNS